MTVMIKMLLASTTTHKNVPYDRHIPTHHDLAGETSLSTLPSPLIFSFSYFAGAGNLSTEASALTHPIL